MQQAMANGAQVWYHGAPDTAGANPLPVLADADQRQLNFAVMEALLAFTDLEVEDKGTTSTTNTTLRQLFTADGVNSWYYHKFRVYFQVVEAYSLLHRLQGCHRACPQLTLYAHPAAVMTLAAQWPGTTVVTAPKPKAKKDYASLLHFGLTFAVRALLGWVQARRLRRKKHLLVEGRHQYRTMLKKDGTGMAYQNAMSGYMVQQSGEGYVVLDLLLLPKFDGSQRFRAGRRHWRNLSGQHTLHEEYVLLRALLGRQAWKRTKAVGRQWQQHYAAAEAAATAAGPIQHLMLAALKGNHGAGLLFHFKYLAFVRFFERYPFNTVTTIDEYSANFKLVLDAAKRHGIRTLGIQHGNFHTLHPGYLYSPADAAEAPYPDTMLLWGPRWAGFLTNHGHWPAHRLQTVGQLRTDVIPELESSNALKPVSTPDHNPIIVFASQPFKDDALRWRLATIVFEAMAELPNAHLVLKPHPNEANPNHYHTLARQAGCDNYSLRTDIDLYLLLSQCQALVTCYSTVGVEAIYFNKPLIALDPLKQDQAAYVADGVAQQATDADSLRQQLANGMAQGWPVPAAQYRQYVADNACQIDGQVAQRILAAIEQAPNNKKSS